MHARNVMEAERTSGAAEPALTAATTTEDGGLWAVVRGPSGVAGVLAVRAREDGVPYTPDCVVRCRPVSRFTPRVSICS